MIKGQSLASLGAVLSLVFVPALSQAEINNPDDTVKAQLEQAKQVLKEAEQTAEKIILDAQQQAKAMHADGLAQAGTDDLSPLLVQNAKVSIEISGGTIEEIVNAIMPSDWRVLVDVKDEKLSQRRFQFVSTRTREQALNDLLKPIGMKHQYFFDLQDAQGHKAPLLVVSVAK